MHSAFWTQVQHLTAANLKSRYRKTIAGFLWVVLNPVLMYGVQSQIFMKVLKLDIHNFYLHLLTGLLPWIFLSQTLEMCTTLFQNNGPLLKAFPSHPLVYLFAQVTDCFINFVAAFFLILIPVTLFEPADIRGVLLFPLPLFALALNILGMAWFLATLQVFFRDTRFLVTFGLSVAFFLTPVFYPIEYVPENIRPIIEFNPFSIAIAPFRASIYKYDFDLFLLTLGKSVLVGAALLGLASFFWKKKKNALYFHV